MAGRGSIDEKTTGLLLELVFWMQHRYRALELITMAFQQLRLVVQTPSRKNDDEEKWMSSLHQRLLPSIAAGSPHPTTAASRISDESEVYRVCQAVSIEQLLRLKRTAKTGILSRKLSHVLHPVSAIAQAVGDCPTNVTAQSASPAGSCS